VTVAVFFNAQPHPAPWGGDGIIAADGWFNRAPELHVSYVLAGLVPFSGECGLLVFSKFYHDTWSPFGFGG
jgi:hypothetical protein